MIFINERIRQTALEQSAWDVHCRPEDFCRMDNVIARSVPCHKARKYLTLPHVCNLISRGTNIVAA